MTTPEQPSEPALEPKAGTTDQPGKTSLATIFKRLGPAGFLAIAWAALPAIGGIVLLTFIGDISAWLQQHQGWGVVLYVVIFIFSAGFGALPTYSQSLLGGWAFGLTTGFLAAWAGFIGASMVGYVVARTVSRRRVERLIDENPKAKAVREALLGHGPLRTTAIVALIRVPPNSPFALTNLAMAASGVKLMPYVLGTALGMAPRTFAAVWLAVQAAGRGDDLVDVVKSKDLWQIIAMVVATVIVLGVIGHISKKALAKVSGGEPRPVKAD
jgi:uncharacterized membrane protein YdjX (TVP38/TMEM64 family)